MNKGIYLKLIFLHLLFACQQSEDSPRGYQCKACILYESDKFKDALAPSEGPIKPSHVSEIKSETDYIPSKDELIDTIKQAPKKEGSIPIKINDVKNLPLKDQQIIRILVNQGHLSEKGSYYVGHDGTVLTISNLSEFIYRFDIALNYQSNQQQKDSDEEENQDAENETDLPAKNTKKFSRIESVLVAVSAFFWGYREWTTNSSLMKQAKVDYKERLTIKQKFDEIDTIIRTDTKPGFKNKIEIPSPTKPKFGPLYAPSSAKFGKYVFSPLLIAISAITMGITIEDIRN